MKVGDSEILPQQSRPSQPPQKPEAPARSSDSIGSGIAAAVGAAKEDVGASRVARVQELANQVKSGAYQPNPQEIASRILDEAELDAELEAHE